jgi:transcriptional regulator with GAF, ATPase, and Fis domain
VSEQRIAEVFVELADTLVDDFDVLDFLHVLTDRCVELLEVSSSGLMLSDERGHLQLVAGTSRTTQDLELLELEMEEGPCVDAFVTAEPIVNVSLTDAARRWPNFTRAALDSGVQRTTALPMRLRGRVIGALNLFSGDDEDMTPTKLALGQAMADIATIGLLNERSLREKTVLSEQLQTALHSRVVIEQAKGVLAARFGISVADAFNRLRKHARRSGSSLTDLAAAVVAGRADLEDLVPEDLSPVDGWEND